jgi:hypothetical protein
VQRAAGPQDGDERDNPRREDEAAAANGGTGVSVSMPTSRPAQPPSAASATIP